MTPQLRFPQFTDEWQVKKLGEAFEEVTSKVGDANVETYSITAGKGFVSQAEKFGRDISGSQNERYTLLSQDELAYNKGNSKSYTYGCVYANRLGKPIAVPNVFISFKPQDERVLSGFYEQLFISRYLDKHLRKIISSGARMDGLLNVNKKDFFEIPIPIPAAEEQQKIAEFLTAVDYKISALEQKVEKLETYKRGMMQKIFSQQIRFTRDDGSQYPEWETRKLGELGEFRSGVGFSDSQQGGKMGVPFYKVSDMNLSGNKVTMTEANNYVTDEQIRANGYRPIEARSIIFAKVGAAIFLERKRVARGFLIDNNMMAFTPKGHLSFDYIKLVFDKIRLSAMAQVGALPSYNGSDLAVIKVILPNIDEQQKIADYLSALDQKITLTRDKLEKTKEFKKGLLQRMLV